MPLDAGTRLGAYEVLGPLGAGGMGEVYKARDADPEPLSSSQPGVPPMLDQLVRTCLRKSPDERWQSAGDIGRQLSWILQESSPHGSTSSAPVVPPAARTARRAWLVPAIAGSVALAAVALAVWALTRSSAAPPPAVSRLTLTPASNAPVVSVGGVDVLITPDGQRVVYLGARPEGGRMLYVRELSSLESRPIPGTELPSDFAVANPFITADGESVVFRSPGKGILSVPIRGGSSLKLADDSPRYLSGTSAADDTVVLALGDGLYRTSARGGGVLERLTAPRDQVVFIAPWALPGGRAVLYHTLGLRERVEQVFAIDLRTREEYALAEGGSPQYAPSGHLVFARGTTLMAVPFDAETLTIRGTPVQVQDGVQHPGPLSAPDYSLSANGSLIYVPAVPAVAAAVAPVWVDRSGRELAPVVPTPLPNIAALALSPDSDRLAIAYGPPQDQDLWVYDLKGRPPLRLAEKGMNMNAVWSLDGTRLIFISNREGSWATFSILADGSALEPQVMDLGIKELVRGVPTTFPRSWLPDGRLVFADQASVAGNANLRAAAKTPGGEAEALVQTQYSEDFGRVSPDGRWLAYTSDRSGRAEIWVQPLSDGAPVRMSSNGGDRPVWSRDGRELFYREGTRMMAVRMKPGAELAFEPAMELFDSPYRPDFDVAPDGRFLMVPIGPGPGSGGPGNRAGGPPAPATPTSIVVVQNWTEELKRLVPVR